MSRSALYNYHHNFSVPGRFIYEPPYLQPTPSLLHPLVCMFFFSLTDTIRFCEISQQISSHLA